MDLHAAALGAVARSRSVGLHFWGQILGVTPLNSQPGHTRMRLVPESTALPRSSGARQPVDVTALATVADITSGLAVRSQVTGRNRLATISFSLQQVQPAYGAVTCHSELVWTEPGGERSLVRAQLTDGTDALVATAQAWFLTLPLSERATLTPMPWERTAAAVPHLTAADLSETELAAATAATLACGRATSAGTSLARELLGLEWTERTEERIVGQAPVDT